MTILYLNPFCSIIDDGEQTALFATREQQVFLTQNNATKLLDSLPCSEAHLLSFLKENEIASLLKANILKIHELETEKSDSINRGWFASRNEETIYANIKEKTVLILGCGGLGTHSAWAMTALGVKKIILIDNDVIAEDNLNRQLFYTQKDIGKAKVDILQKKLTELNSQIEIVTYQKKILEPHHELTEIIHTHGPIDVAIKAVDSPDNHIQLFSNYFSEMKIPYTSGGTLGDGYVLGPTYHPKLANKYKKEIDGHSTQKRIYVKGISLPMIMEKVAAEVNLEALNLLSNRLNAISFNESLSYHNLYFKNNLTKKSILNCLQFFILGVVSSFIGLMAALFIVFYQKSSSNKIIYITSLFSGFLFKKIYCLETIPWSLPLILLVFSVFISCIPLTIYCIYSLFSKNERSF